MEEGVKINTHTFLLTHYYFNIYFFRLPRSLSQKKLQNNKNALKIVYGNLFYQSSPILPCSFAHPDPPDPYHCLDPNHKLGWIRIRIRIKSYYTDPDPGNKKRFSTGTMKILLKNYLKNTHFPCSMCLPY